MFKKIITIVALLAVIGVLVWGAINRTQAKATSESENTSQGGYSGGTTSVAHTVEVAASAEQNREGNGSGQNSNARSEAESARTRSTCSQPLPVT